AGGGQDRRHPGGEADAGPDPAVPPDRPARGDRGPDGDRRRGHDRGDRADRGPDRGGGGGGDRGPPGRARPGRHGQGGGQDRRDQRRAAGGEIRRQVGIVAAGPVRALAITASNRAASGVYAD